jgi:hypothetical protein
MQRSVGFRSNGGAPAPISTAAARAARTRQRPEHPATHLLCLPEQLLPGALLRDRPALCCEAAPPLAIDLMTQNSPLNQRPAQRFEHCDEIYALAPAASDAREVTKADRRHRRTRGF